MISKLKILAVLATVFLVLPESLWAAAEEAGHEGWGWLETIGRWFNLALLFGVIYHFAGTSIKQFFRDRRQDIQHQLRAAEKAREAAQTRLATIEERLGNLDDELAQIREESRQQAESERLRILEQTQLEADKILASAEREIGGMSQSARKDLKVYASHLAIQLAEDRIRQELTAGDDARMIGDFFTRLGQKAGGGRPS